MNVKYPDFFTASYLVAGKWNADVVAPLAKNKIWFMASVDDLGHFRASTPSLNAWHARARKSAAPNGMALGAPINIASPMMI